MTKWWPFLRKEISDDGPVPLPDPVLVERSEGALSDELRAIGYDDENTFRDGAATPGLHREAAHGSSVTIEHVTIEQNQWSEQVFDVAPPDPVIPGPGITSDPESPESPKSIESQGRPPAVDLQVEPGVSWLAVDNVGKSFSGRKVASDVSLLVRQGEAVGLLGPNGAGKTTVFYMIMGLLTSDTGRIALDGNDITHLPMYQRARLGIGYLPQEASIFRGLTVEANIRAVLEFVEPKRKRREEQLDALLEEFNITHIRKSPAIALSGGERRRVEIARALASRPSFMLLDEPFAGVDPIAIGDIRNLVHHLTQRGIGVLITDHNVRETLALIDRAYIIYSGSVLMEGTPEEIIN
ncbi:MAG: LPS export ABC transporter ATP-binding protein, partial [Fimbriimonadaceae bacterium]|nr:LPS export ABC transporter ATP-binding protein [Alphaproteobacteria bacterium]